MEINQYKVFSTWKPRAETAERLGQRMLRNIDALSGLSPLFHDWWFMDHSRDAMEMTEENYGEYLFPLSEVRDRMTKMVELGVRRNDDGDPEPAGGYGISAFNEIENSGRSVVLSAHGGGTVDPRAGLRVAEFQTSSNDPADPAIVAYPMFKSALLALASAWDVEHAQAYSSDLSKLWQKPYKHALDLAWMTYLSPPLARGFVPPANALVEPIEDGGILLIAAEETFDAANPSHLSAAQDILRSLSKINTDKAREADLLWPPRPFQGLQ